MEVRKEFVALLQYLRRSFPRLFAVAEVHMEEPWRLVIELPGSDQSLPPVLFVAHFDVVDITPGTEEQWRYPPFSGQVTEGYVWGRGALDDKNVLGAMLEAAEGVVAAADKRQRGASLRRGLVLAFGGDEELMGQKGAGTIAARFREEKRRFYYSLDEGAVIARDLLAVPKKPVALIGITEKGYVNVRFSVLHDGGHASMPPASTALGILAHAIARIESHPFPSQLIVPVRKLLRCIGERTPGAMGLVYRNARLLWPVIARVLAASPQANALIRTSQAVSMARGSTAPNVLPQRAEAVANVRILPGESILSVVGHYRRLLRRLPVEVSVYDPAEAHEPSPESSVSHPAYEAIARGAMEIVSNAIVAPFVVPGATDSKWYAGLTEGSYRFVPLLLGSEDVASIHGTNERMSVEGYGGMIDFYVGLIERTCR